MPASAATAKASAKPASSEKPTSGKPAGTAKPKAKAVKKATPKEKSPTPKEKSPAVPAPTETDAPKPSTKPATNANGVTQTAALTPGSDPDDVLSGLIR